jgi:hypothetical protein
MVAESILRRGDFARLWTDLDARHQHALVAVVARAHDRAELAERDRLDM